jgi:osmoprotectant transport system permease protein
VSLISFWIAHRGELGGMLQQHVLLVVLSTGVAILLGIPAGIVAAHRPRIGRPLVAAVNIGQTIPSLALLGFLIPLPLVGGVGPRAAIVALILYALLPIVRMTAAGVQSVDRAVREAAVAMGMTPRQVLTMVELPLALPSIVAGIRVATVIGVGTATIAAFIGAGGLGDYIFRGLSMVDTTMILAGAVPAAALALLADAILSRVERHLSPARSRGTRRRWLAAAVVLAIAVVAVIPSNANDGDRVVIGSKNFTEQVILGELLAQTLERHTDLRVVRKLNLGGTFICDRAIRSGDIDIYVEYTGTSLTAIFRQAVAHDRAAVLASTRQLYAGAGLTALDALGFNNTFAILVRRRDAEAMGLRTIGDLRQTDRWRPGFGHEFLQREDGYRGLVTRYDLRFREEPRVMDLTLMYRALATGSIDVIAGDATSGLIDALDLQVLEDDRRYFPPYDAVPVVRSSVLLRRPELGRALSALAGAVSERAMRAMNRAVDLDRRDPADVVRGFMGTLNISQKKDTRAIARCPQFEKC